MGLVSAALGAAGTDASGVGHCGPVEDGVDVATAAATPAIGAGEAGAGWEVSSWTALGAASDDAGSAISLVS
jgi:hypothetical protein